MDLRSPLAAREWSRTLLRDTTSISKVMCMALRNSSHQKGCPQPALQRREHPSRCAVFWLITKAVVCDQMRGEGMRFSTMHAALLLLPIFDRSRSASGERRSNSRKILRRARYEDHNPGHLD